MQIEKTLLVAVDAQKGFAGNEWNRRFVPSVVALVANWQSLSGPTVFTRMFNYAGSPLERLVDYTMMQGPPDTDLIDELQPFAKSVIDKRVYSFFNDEGTRFAANGGYETLAFCGFDTEACVLKSAFDAFDLGYVPLIVEDATASSFGDDKREAGLSVAEAVLGARQIVDSKTLIGRFL